MKEKLNVGDFVKVNSTVTNFNYPRLLGEIGMVWHTAEEFDDYPNHHRIFFAAKPSYANGGLWLFKAEDLEKL